MPLGTGRSFLLVAGQLQIGGMIQSRGRGDQWPDHMLIDDNASPAVAFDMATGFERGNDLQCNHLCSAASDPRFFSDVRNICYTPSFLAKLTDTQKDKPREDHLVHLLRYRAYELYDFKGLDGTKPTEPTGYSAIQWPEPVGAGRDRLQIEQSFRSYLRAKTKNRLSVSVREIGWAFSDYQPVPDFPDDQKVS